MSEKTSIWISKENRSRLEESGKKGDTYDDIITRLLNESAFRKRKDNLEVPA